MVAVASHVIEGHVSRGFEAVREAFAENFTRRNELGGACCAYYHGENVVDLWGVHYYDTGPEKSTQALWDRYQDATYRGGPWGIRAWLRAAQARGKRLGVGEWGVWDQGQGAAKADDRKMQ